MTDYVISYDLCALFIMLLFSSYYFTRKRLDSAKNKTFNFLCIINLLSIVFDILSVLTLRNRAVLPIWVNYFTNECYFIVTGLVSVLFCMYSFSETRSFLGHRKMSIYLINFLPYVFFVLVILSTPFTHLVLYFDNNNDYHQGPLMGILLVYVIVYLGYSMITITFYHDNVSFSKRFSYYCFAAFMTVAIACQWFFPRYLLYGIAEALGIVVMYLSNHNVAEFLDSATNLFNRNALLVKLKENQYTNKKAAIVGIGIRKYLSDGVEQAEGSFIEMINIQVASFLEVKAGINTVYYVDNSSFIIIFEDVKDTVKFIDSVLKRFSDPWKTKNSELICVAGVSKIIIGEDTDSSFEAFDMALAGINYSVKNTCSVATAVNLRDERDKKIFSLETEQKKLEQKFTETENKMQQVIQADKSKSVFLAQMSHEIRTPMTAILGMTELILRETQDSDVTEHANAIMSSGKTLIGIINDILDFSKIEAGKLEIINEEYSMENCIHDLINGIEQRVSEKRLDFSLYFDPSIPKTLYGDSIRVKQIITNLLTNAVKYTEKGEVSISFDVANRTDSEIEFSVSVKDTGIGISKENLQHLFEGFERFDLQRNKYIEGSGLGLAICKQLVELMGGRIEVQSEYGVGSTFTVNFLQKIVNASPSVEISNPESLCMLIYCGRKAEQDSFIRTFADFGIKADFALNSEELTDMYKSGTKYSHVFITYGEYSRRLAAKDPMINDPRLVIDIYYRQYLTDLRGHSVVHMPICSLNFAALLKGRKLTENSHPTKNYRDYVAPSIKLLVVDDNLVNLRIFTGLLACHKMEIDTVDSGDKCILAARNKKYDLIFLDHMMPVKDGIQTFHEMRADAASVNEDTPVIAFTANAVSGMKEMFIENGFSDFLTKPIDISKLEELLISYLPSDKLVYSGSDKPESEEFSVKGLDMEKALFYSGGDVQILKDVLAAFLADGITKKAVLKKAIEDRDFNNYQIQIHAIKSLCKGIGADELSEKARLLEMACKENNPDYVLANYESVHNDFAILLDNISEALK